MSSYLTKQGSRQDYNYKEYMIDTYADINTIDVKDCCQGSVAYIISTGDVYMLNGSKQWIKQ